MGLLNIFDIAGAAMSAQSVRLNATASNLANANSAAGKAEDAYRARQPVFQTVLQDQGGDPAAASVRVAGVMESQAPPPRVYQPGHPQADADGYVYMSNVNVVDEMVNMISASRSYQNSIEVLNTSKELFLRTLSLGS
ncbi:Flagellar basal-body rod protein FlgC [Gammaproteobacteria bacterium]|nr:flagellar basal body rod protein FlgC [Gammaproteobacteria bacterium]QOJ31013.1 MAG: flagellar basal body rod protein FlgC [Gammaproteobacteria bacterium]CAG0938455.1 Flagellar basal-body rod protein FlgC [Gammaproteobacteria bacterium]